MATGDVYGLLFGLWAFVAVLLLFLAMFQERRHWDRLHAACNEARAAGNELEHLRQLHSAGVGGSVTCPECGGGVYDPIEVREPIPGSCALCGGDKWVPVMIAYEFFRGAHGRQKRSHTWSQEIAKLVEQDLDRKAARPAGPSSPGRS